MNCEGIVELIGCGLVRCCYGAMLIVLCGVWTGVVYFGVRNITSLRNDDDTSFDMLHTHTEWHHCTRA